MNLNKLKNSTLSPPTRVIKNSIWPNLITQSQQKHKKHVHWMAEKCRQLQNPNLLCLLKHIYLCINEWGADTNDDPQVFTHETLWESVIAIST